MPRSPPCPAPQVAPLLKEDPAVAAAKDADEAEGASMDEDTVLELAPLSMMIQGLQHDNTDTKCRLLNSAYRHVGAGSLSLMPFTLVPLIFGCLGLARRIRGRVLAEEKVEVSPHKLLVFTAKIINALVSLAPTLAHRLYLQAAQTADAVGEEAVAYEFLTQSFIVYEEEIADSRAKLAAVTLATATLPHMGGFEKDHYEALSTQTVQHCAKLLKKPDQCRAVRAASYLFAGGGDFAYANPKRVLECLQRSLKIADACKVSGMHTQLFVEILDVYLWHFEHENELVTATYMNSLVQARAPAAAIHIPCCEHEVYGALSKRRATAHRVPSSRSWSSSTSPTTPRRAPAARASSARSSTSPSARRAARGASSRSRPRPPGRDAASRPASATMPRRRRGFAHEGACCGDDVRAAGRQDGRLTAATRARFSLSGSTGMWPVAWPWGALRRELCGRVWG